MPAKDFSIATKCFTIVIEVLHHEDSPLYVLRAPNGMPLKVTDTLAEVESYILDRYSELGDVKSVKDPD